MHLIVVRHGETDWNVQKRTQGITDTKLTARGEGQAKLLARRVSNMKIDRIVTSPLLRAYETGKTIADSLHKPIQTDDALREICFGVWEGLTFNEIGERYPNEFSVWEKTPLKSDIPQAEKLSDVVARVDDFLARMKASYFEQTIVAVTHSLPSKLLVSRSIGLSVDNIHSIRIDNTSLTILDYYHDRAVLRLMNDTVHLQDGVVWQT